MSTPDLHTHVQRELRRRTHPDVLARELTEQGLSPAEAAALIADAQSALESACHPPTRSPNPSVRRKRRLP